MDQEKNRVLVCAGAGCVSSGCKAVARAFREAMKEAGLDNKVEVVETGCIGACDLRSGRRGGTRRHVLPTRRSS